MINEKTLSVLEYDKVLKLVSSFAYSRPGKERLLTELPNSNYEKVKELLDQTKEADRLMYEMCVNISFAIDDIHESLELVHKGITLNCEQLIKIARVLHVAKVAKKDILNTPDDDFIILKQYCNRIFIGTSIEEKINSCIMSETEVSSNASEKLFSIRNSITNTNRKIREKLNSYITSGTYASYLQEGLVTIRNNRYVIPVKSEYKSSIKGLVHDQSASGSTTYIEPLAIVELNNDLRTYQIEEQTEIENILRSLSYDIDSSYFEICQTYDTLIELDCIFAKAAYSRSIKGVYPDLNNCGQINIIQGRHPLIDKGKVVPVSISLVKHNTLLISGPNTGGKTVSIKLVGIVTLMAMSGIFIPAKIGSMIAVFDDVLCDIGDDQSIENNLSTFSAHLISIINVIEKANEQSLALMDELGAGTDPVEGSALAIAVVTYLKERHVRTIVTSHFKEMKEFAYASKDVNIAGMDFDPDTFKPTYNLLMGQTASSNALEIAKVLGLNSEIVDKAKSLISEEDNKFNNIIRGAEINRREAVKLKAEAESELIEARKKSEYYDELIIELEKKKEKLEEKLAKSAKEVLGDYLEEAEDLVEELKEKVVKGDEQSLFEARVLKKRLENMQVTSKEKIHYDKVDGIIQVGDDVYVKSLNKTGTVVSIAQNNKECSVKVGILTSLIKIKDLQKVLITNKQKDDTKNIKVHYVGDLSFNITAELNLIGKRCEEALFELEEYLYKAKTKGYKEVRIVHGKGEGILRNAVQDYLKTSNLVKSYRLGGYGEGDYGVTVVTFKE